MKLGQLKDKTKRKKTIISTVGKQGIYAVAFVCLAVAGIVLAVSMSSAPQDAELPQITPSTIPSTVPTQQPDKDVSGNTNVVIPETMQMPVNGEITKEHVIDRLIYDETMQQWCTHSGIDIACNEGEPVKAAMSGTVEVCKSDVMQGNVVIINHGNGLKTVYAGLEAVDDSIKAGDTVAAGTEIGTAGISVQEMADGAHLHFEVWKNNTAQDPMEYLEDYIK